MRSSVLAAVTTPLRIAGVVPESEFARIVAENQVLEPHAHHGLPSQSLAVQAVPALRPPREHSRMCEDASVTNTNKYMFEKTL